MKKIIYFISLLLITSAFANSTAKVDDYNGSPTMFINGKPTVPMMFYGYAAGLTNDPNCQFAQQAKYMTNANMHLYTIPIDFNYIFDNGIRWWFVVDDVLTALTNFDCNAIIMPRIYLYPSQWYMDANPDIMMEWSDGDKGRICLASQKWRDYMYGNLQEFVSHVESKFGNNVFGYHLTLMDTGEWFYERSWENVFSGYSENMRLGFANWVQNKYGTEAALQAAWNDSSVTFSTITLPTTTERSSSAHDFFRDPAGETKTIDFYLYKNHLVPETIDLMAGAVKSRAQNKIVAAFYGYANELSRVPKGPAITGHLALKELLQSDNVDIIASPMSYVNRRGGGICAFMNAADSVREAGKLWFVECDMKTYLDTSGDHNVDGYYPTLAQTQWAHDTVFSHVISRRMGIWFMDLFNKGWLNSQGIWENISRLNNIYKGQLGTPSTWNPEVAVIVDEKGPCYLACNNEFSDPLYYSLRTRLYRMGVPFNTYLLADVLDGTVTLPKVNIFLGAWHLTTNERTTLHTALSGKAAVWFHGAGYYNEDGAATANIEDLTGFDVVLENNFSAQITFVDASPWTDGLAGSTFKPCLFDSGNSSVYETEDQNITYDICWAVGGPGNAVQLGTYGSGSFTGLAVMDYLGFKSFYCGIAGIPAKFLRNVCKNMGVHVYVDDDYVMDTDGSFLSVCSPKNETQSIVLSNNYYLTDMESGSLKSSSGGVVNESFSSVGQNKTYWIGKNTIGGFTDKSSNKGLWHCDNSYLPGSYWVAGDDDNSSGRTEHSPLLNYGHLHTHVTAPSLLPNSPKGGNYYKFNGKDDNIIGVNVWQNENKGASVNLSLRWRDLPSLSDNYKYIIWSSPWELLLQNNGSDKGKLWLRVKNSAGTGYTDLYSSFSLNSNEWYDVSFEVYTNDVIRLSVNNYSDTTMLNGGMYGVNSDVYVGGRTDTSHSFMGDMDEIRFGISTSVTNISPNIASTAYWRFEEGTDGVAHSGHDDNWYIDSSGDGNDSSAWGSEVNPIATSDVPFNTVPLTSKPNTLALRFTGSQNISTASDSLLNTYTFPGGFTVECMVKYNDFNFGVSVCKEGKPSSTYDDPNFCIKHRGTSPYQLQLQFFDGGGNRHDLRSNMTPDTGVWYCVAAVCNGSDAKLYIKHPTGDYELVAEDIGTISGTSLYDDNEKWVIGRSVWQGSPTDYLNGNVDEVRITNVALNISQFLGTEPEPPAGEGKTTYWRFEEGTDGVAHSGHDDNWYIDSSGDGNDSSAWGSEVNPIATSDVPFDIIPLTSKPNTLALRFTGSQNISTASNSPLNTYTFPSGFTVEYMVKYNDFNFNVAVCKEGQPFAAYGDPNFCLKRRGNSPYALQFQFFDGAGNRHDLRSDITPNTGIWYCVAAVCDGADAKLYVKEPDYVYQIVAAETGTVSGSALYDDEAKWTVGRGAWVGNPTDYLSGNIDEVRITNVALDVSDFLGGVPEPSLIISIIALIGLFFRMRR